MAASRDTNIAAHFALLPITARVQVRRASTVMVPHTYVLNATYLLGIYRKYRTTLRGSLTTPVYVVSKERYLGANAS